MNPDELRSLFTGRYEDPVVEDFTVHLREEARGLGFRFCSVFEKAWATEDPLHPHVWLVTPQGRLYERREGLRALQEMKYEPATERDAIGAAILVAVMDLDGGVISEERPELSEEVAGQVRRAPRVERSGLRWHVTLDMYDGGSRYFKEECVWRCVIAIGGGGYEIEKEKLWARATESDGGTPAPP